LKIVPKVWTKKLITPVKIEIFAALVIVGTAGAIEGIELGLAKFCACFCLNKFTAVS